MKKATRKRIQAAFFRQQSGKEPVRDWLLELNADDRKIIGDDIRTAEFGWPIGMPICRQLNGRPGLWEVRSSLSTNRIARVFFLHQGWNDGFASRHHQEDPANATEGTEPGRTENEGVRQMTNKRKKNPAIGSSFESFLDEQGTLTQTTNQAIKRVLAYQLQQAMEDQQITKKELAERMHTSRSQLNRVLDPDNNGVTLEALINAADAVGRTLTIEMQ